MNYAYVVLNVKDQIVDDMMFDHPVAAREYANDWLQEQADEKYAGMELVVEFADVDREFGEIINGKTGYVVERVRVQRLTMYK